MSNYEDLIKIALIQLQKRLTAEKFRNEISQAVEMSWNKGLQAAFNDEMVRKTQYYQKKFGFEIRNKKGNEFWNNEADAFKHTFGSAELYFKYGEWGSLLGGIYHEWQTPKNPQGEWNMDFWNNNQGREIAKEILKEYGNRFMTFPQQYRDDIIASKVMQRMRRGELITHPDDKRIYKGWIEKKANKHPEILRQMRKMLEENKPTGFAADINYDILSEVTGLPVENLLQNDNKNKPHPQSSLYGYTNPITGNDRIYTREEIGKMTRKEYAKISEEIKAQMRSIGIPSNFDMGNEIKNGAVVYVHPYTRSDGTQVSGYFRSRPRY